MFSASSKWEWDFLSRQREYFNHLPPLSFLDLGISVGGYYRNTRLGYLCISPGCCKNRLKLRSAEISEGMQIYPIQRFVSRSYPSTGYPIPLQMRINNNPAPVFLIRLRGHLNRYCSHQILWQIGAMVAFGDGRTTNHHSSAKSCPVKTTK
jgi:hypothetical protein